ncbi:MAG: class I SAM-dependent methyltransferase [Candidatus Pacebacteria bacterium]|nr:class I SAM-dependent methyltransferase [Candidatus Paceibacterota bacterium]
MAESKDDFQKKDVKIIGAEGAPVLPDLSDAISLLIDLHQEIEDIPEGADVLLDFYYPLISVVFSLSKTALTRLNSIIELTQLYPNPFLDGRYKKIQHWLRKYVVQSGSVLELCVEKLNEGNEVLDHALIAYVDEYTNAPFQWNEATLIWVAQWLTLILEKDQRKGNPPFYVYIKKKQIDGFPEELPRIFEGNDWLSGFGSRLLILPGVRNLTNDQKTEIWNYLLMEAGIYEDLTINHTIRENVFQAILDLFPAGDILHLDLCGGKGDFITWLRKSRPNVRSILIDLADKAVMQAHQRGVLAAVGTAERPPLLKYQVDVITIIFAIQWLSPEAFIHALEVLKPGGYLIANVYPYDLPQVEELFVDMLKKAGFVTIERTKVRDKNRGKNQYIVRAQKPYEKHT